MATTKPNIVFFDNTPHLHNLEWDPREEHRVSFPHAWVAHPMAAAGMAFLSTMALEPPIKPGTPDPYTPPKPGEMRVEEHINLGAITQFVTSLVESVEGEVKVHADLEHHSG